MKWLESQSVDGVDDTKVDTSKKYPKRNEEIKLSKNSKTILEKRYIRKDKEGNAIETTKELFERVSKTVAEPDKKHQDEKLTEISFYNMLTKKKFLPNSPTFTGAGTPLGQLAACFVLPIADDMGREQSGIFSTLRDAALVQQTGGGNGFSFSDLRSRGEHISKSAGEATGPVGFLSVYDAAFAEIAQGGCLLPDTLVFTNEGLLRLDEIVNSDALGWQEHSLNVQTDKGTKQSPRGFNNGKADVYRVQTKEGLSIAGTKNHKVKIMGENGLEWKAIEHLTENDYIAVYLNGHKGNMQKLEKPQRHYGNQIMPTFPEEINEDLAFFLGYLMGDGFMVEKENDYRLGVSVAHSSYLMEEMPILLNKLFGVNVCKQQKDKGKSTDFVIDSRALKKFFEMNGLKKEKSLEVSIPLPIRKSPRKVVGAFLKGLFEADGTLSHGYPTLLTSSSQLAHETATLLVGLGCPVYINSESPDTNRYGSSKMYRVRISSVYGLEAWKENIGCDERSRLALAYEWNVDLTKESSYVLANPSYWLDSALDSVTLPQKDRRARGINFRSTKPKLRRRVLRYVRGDRALTRSGLELLRSKYPEEFRRAPLVENLWFVSVDDVSHEGKSLTLDLEVEDNHTYLAQGMVTHNTRRGANMAVLRVDHPDIVEFIKCKTDEGSISNFNISVAITDEFMQAVKDDTTYKLIDPHSKNVCGEPKAREIFDLIVEHAYHNGEPGVLFIDEANRYNPVPHLYELKATNPCITGDTLVYTKNGLRRAIDLAVEGDSQEVVIDGRFDVDTFQKATHVFPTGSKDIYKLKTIEGYELKLTKDHKVKTNRGWIEAKDLKKGDKIHILNRFGGFGNSGTYGEGMILGWVVGDGTINKIRTVLSFFGKEKQELAPTFASTVTKLVNTDEYSKTSRTYEVGVTQIEERDEARVASERLNNFVKKYGLDENKLKVPDLVFEGSKETQVGFLQALFTADGHVNSSETKGCSARLTSINYKMLQDVQRLLLNFGIASKIYKNRHKGGKRLMPNGKGGKDRYYCKPCHELAISKNKLAIFASEIGFLSSHKQDRLVSYISGRTRGLYKEKFTVRFDNLEHIGKEIVYDLIQPSTHSFIANGLVVHNCGEQYLGPYENCCLGSINLSQHLTEEGQLDWSDLKDTIRLSTKFLDNVVTANKYVDGVPQIKEAAMRARRIGLGLMGLADVMYEMGIRYGSEESFELAAKIMEYIRYHSMQRSIELAEQRGPFPAIKGSIYDPKNLTWKEPKPLNDYKFNFERPLLDWSIIKEGIKTHGIRNAAQTTIAPTGTVSTVAGVEGYGCEPVFALAYYRNVYQAAGDEEGLTLTYTSPMFEKALDGLNISDDEKKEIIEEIIEKGTCRDVSGLPDKIRNTFVVSSDITSKEHILMQASLQAFVDNSISKTCNFPEEATKEDVAEVYKLGWEKKVKGLTVYVAGSRDEVVLETKETKGKKGKKEDIAAVLSDRADRGYRLSGSTYKVKTPQGKAYVTINKDKKNKPIEVFLNVGKAGSDVAALSEALGRSISGWLRASINPVETIKEMASQFIGIGGARSIGFGSNKVSSLPDAVAKVLAEDLDLEVYHNGDAKVEEKTNKTQGIFANADMCPECGNYTFIKEEGCQKCYNCGHSVC